MVRNTILTPSRHPRALLRTGYDLPPQLARLTMQQAMGVSTDAWGSDEMRATRPVSEILI